MHRLELDRANRYLGPPKADLPRDIVIKLHYYTFKEEVLQSARATTSLHRPLSYNNPKTKIPQAPASNSYAKQN